MPRKRATDQLLGPPGAEELAFCESLMLQRLSRAQLVRAFQSARAEPHPDAPPDFVPPLLFPGIAPGTIDDCIRRVRERWHQEAEAERPLQRELTLRRLAHLSRQAEAAGRLVDAASFERLLVEIHGLKGVEKIAHVGPDGGPVRVAASVVILPPEDPPDSDG